MDGGGISSTQERKIILEAIKIIRQRNKHISFLEKTRSYSALFRRLVLFFVRVFLKKSGFVNILVIIKRIKYKRFLIIK
jgi:hypothetical protein